MPNTGIPFRKPITLDTLDDLFAHHRSAFGGWRMEEDPAPDGGACKPDEKPATFEPITSQEDLDRRIGPRLAREREKFADYAALKEKATKYDEGVQANLSEQEKALAEARKEGESTALQSANERVVRAEAKAAAAGAKFRDAEVAVRLLDLSSVKVGDDGSVDADALKGLLDNLAKSHPYLVDDGKGSGPRPDPSQGGGKGSDAPSVSRGAQLYAERHKKSNA